MASVFREDLEKLNLKAAETLRRHRYFAIIYRITITIIYHITVRTVLEFIEAPPKEFSALHVPFPFFQGFRAFELLRSGKSCSL